ncbi:MAG: proton-conducting transporter transmembrane domain-containing protein [Vulcanimicrobiaceae bacterium]
MSALHILLGAIAAAGLGSLLAAIVPGGFGRFVSFLGLLIAGMLAVIAGAWTLQSTTSAVTLSTTAHISLRLDPVAGFFVALIGIVAVLVALYALGGKAIDERRTGRTAASASCVILLASLLACTANDVLFFIFAWEFLALAFFWAITFAGPEEGSARAGYLTLVVTHVAGAALVIALLVLARAAGNFDVSSAIGAAAREGTLARSAIFMLLLVGFGAKFGMLPMQAWLRYGYTAAPSAVAALMAGGAINVGFYGVARFIVPLGGHVPTWWAILVLALGAIGAVYGIALASAERDLRALAAYSSVENAGIILAAFGAALVGRSVGDGMLYGLGIAAAFLQIIAHALAKCTLFLGCSALRERCGSTSFEQLGGLAGRMRLTTIVVLVCALSLAALPPLAGFAGEWLVLETMMQAFRTGDVAIETAMAICGALVGLAAGIAIVAFVKVVGVALLGAARSDGARQASEVPSMAKRSALVVCGLLVVGAGVFGRNLITFLAPAIHAFGNSGAAGAIAGTPPLIQPAYPGFSSIAPIGLLCAIGGFSFLFWLLVQVIQRPAPRKVPVWTSGEAYHEWTQYTGTGFANPTRVILDAMTRTVRSIRGDTYASESRPYFGLQWYERIAKRFLRIADVVRLTQSGVIAAYLAYILGFTIILLLLYPSIRNW